MVVLRVTSLLWRGPDLDALSGLNLYRMLVDVPLSITQKKAFENPSDAKVEPDSRITGILPFTMGLVCRAADPSKAASQR